MTLTAGDRLKAAALIELVQEHLDADGRLVKPLPELAHDQVLAALALYGNELGRMRAREKEIRAVAYALMYSVQEQGRGQPGSKRLGIRRMGPAFRAHFTDVAVMLQRYRANGLAPPDRPARQKANREAAKHEAHSS